MAKFKTASINLSKIDKSKLFTGKTGDKFVNVIIWDNSEPDQYGNDGSIQQSATKEEREAGYKGPYLGNYKQMGGAQTTAPSQAEMDDLPF